MRSIKFAIPVCCSLLIAYCAVAFAQTDPVENLVERLSLAKYKSAIKGLTQFGDREQGTESNRAAVDWIEATLRSYGCADTERLSYFYDSPGESGTQSPLRGKREEVYCTKIGATHPDEMYIVGAHMDGTGQGEAVDDDASGAALVMELARVFSNPAVRTERSIRFVLWNNEETGLDGSRAYIARRAALQGKESPPGSGKYPEPRWLGMIQHDMILFDHGMPRADGTVNPEQRREADINIEFRDTCKLEDQAMKLAYFFRAANEKYVKDYPATVGDRMADTDSESFMDLVPTITLRENERTIRGEPDWNPYYHRATDRFTTYSDKDFDLGLTTAQTTLAAVAELVGAQLKDPVAGN